MITLAILNVSFGLATLPPLQPDTPPALPVPASQLALLKSMNDVIGVTLLGDHSRAPADIVLPELLNRRQALQYMRVHYPESMLKTSNGSVPVAWMFVDDKGSVAEAQLVTTTGHAELDSLSLQVVRLALFKPAQHAGKAVGVWIPFPARVPPHDELIAMLETLGRDKSEAPVETTYTQKPVLLNRIQVEAAIIRVVHSVSPAVREMNEMYARSQRLGGITQMQIYIDKEGVVQNAIVKKTSGNLDLDRSATNIAKMMRFSPARNGDEPVDVWIEVPIRFKAN